MNEKQKLVETKKEQSSLKSQKKKLSEKAKIIEPILRIGKSGLTESVIEEIKKQLQKKRLIKIKILKSALEDKDKKELAIKLAPKAHKYAIEAKSKIELLFQRIGKL